MNDNLRLRVDHLEKQLRMWRLVFFSVVAVFALFAAAPRIPGVVEGTAFVLKDPDGHKRGLFHIDHTGSATVELLDRAGTPVLWLSEGRPDPELASPKRSPSPNLTILGSEGPTVMLSGEQDRASLSLGRLHRVNASLTASESTGASLNLENPAPHNAFAIISAADEASVELEHAKGGAVHLVSSETESSFEAYLCRSRQDKKPGCVPAPKLTAAVRSEGSSLQLDDADGFQTQVGISDLITPTTGAKTKTSAASVILFDKSKKVLWSAP